MRNTTLKVIIYSICGAIFFLFGLGWLLMGPSYDTWTIYRTCLSPTEILSENYAFIENKSRTYHYYLKAESSGCGEHNNDYLILKDENGVSIKISKFNYKFFNKAEYSYVDAKLQRTSEHSISNFSGRLYYKDKTYTLKEFFENTPEVVHQRYKRPLWLNIVIISSVVIAAFISIPFYMISDNRKKKNVRKEGIEFFGHLKMLLKTNIEEIWIEIDDLTTHIEIEHSTEKISIKNRYFYDTVCFDYPSETLRLRKSDILDAHEFFTKNSNHIFYNKIADVVMDYINGDAKSKKLDLRNC